MGSLNTIFDSAIKNSIFKNKEVMQANYTPETIPHREKQIEHLASIMAPVLRGEKCSNVFLYGKTGTGKTLSIQFVSNELKKKAKEVGAEIRIEYLNCKLKKVADTEYRILAALIEQMGGEIAETGLPTGQVYNKFVNMIDQKKQVVVLIFDEIDQAVKKINDGFLYSLTRLNSELSKAQISLIGISNDVTFLENIDPRVKSSLGEEEIVFPPYDALQLQDILNKRGEQAFKEGAIEGGVIRKCAAYAAREHGDARRALDLLRIAGELAERDGKGKVEEKYIDSANQKMERDKILDIIETGPKQFQIVLYSIIQLTKKLNKSQEQRKDFNNDFTKFFTGDVYNHYQDICSKVKIEVLTQRRISDIIDELNMLGLINTLVISKGRHGRTREIKLVIPQNLTEKVEASLIDSLGL
jgi:cell division control protein 6